MADDVVIGSASVQIVGDYSGLEKSFTASQNLAQQAGQKIAAAFTSTAAGASALDKAVSTVADTVQDLATKSGLAGGELNLFRAALQGSLEAGVPVAAALQDMAASSTTLGTAVAAAAQGLMQEVAAAQEGVGANEALGDSFKRVRNDAEALEAAWERAIAEDKKLADAAKKDAADFAAAWDAAIKENMQRNAAAFEKFATDVQNFITHPLQSAGEAVKGFLLEIGPVGAVALAGAAALAIVGNELLNLVKEFGAAAEATGNMADRLNLTWRETRNLEEMAQIAGVSISGLQQASFRLAESLDETSANGKKVAEALQSIGVTGNTTGQLLTGFLQKLAQIPDDTQRIALAHEVLGRSSQQILPLIKNYGELQKAIRELGPAIGDQLAGDLQKADDSLDKLNISWNRFKEEIAAGVAPAIGALVDQFRMLIVETSKLAQETASNAKALAGMIPDGLIATLGEFAKTILHIQSLANPFVAAIRTMIGVLEEFNLVAGAISGKAAADFQKGVETMNKSLRDNLTQSLHAATTGTKEFIEVFKNGGGGVATTIQNILDAQTKLSTSVRDAKGAYDQLNEAFKTGQPLFNGHRVTLQEVERALANLRAAEAAASLTKAEHTKQVENFSKALRPAADNVAIFVRQLELMKSAHQKLISDAAEFSNTFGKSYNVADVAAIRAAAAATTLRQAFEELGDENVTFSGNADKVAPLMAEMAKSMNDVTKAALEAPALDKMQASLKALGIPVEEFGKKVRIAKDDAAEFVAANSTDLDHVTIAWQRMNSEVGRLSSVNLPAAISMQEELIASMNRMGAPLGQIEIAQEKLLQLEIKLHTERGKSSNSEIIALANLRAGTAALSAANNILGNTYVALMQDFQRAFDSLGGEFATAIMEGKSFTATWKAALHQLETQILSTVISAIVKFGVSWVTAHVLGTAASTAHTTTEIAGITAVSAARAASTTAQIAEIAAVTVAQTAALATFTAAQLASFVTIKAAATLLDVSEVLGSAAVGGAAAAASTAAIPIIGPALALEVGAAMYASIAGIYGPLATFSEGGMVPEDMLALVHKGEYVLPAEKTAAAIVGGGGGTAVGETHVHISFSGAHFNGTMSDREVTKIFDRGFRMSKLAGALPPGRFPQ